MEAWIEANIFVHQGKQRDVLLGFIKPLIQQLRSDFGITAYHFLYEPDNEIRFRVLTSDDKVDRIKGIIENLRGLPQVRDLKYPQIPFNGERTAFGEDGWKTTYKFLEAGSDFALDLLDSSVRKGPHFNPIAFSHYFLNQQGLDQFTEATAHFQCSMERMLVIVQESYTKPLQEKTNQLESYIKSIESRIKKIEKRINRPSSIAQAMEKKISE